MRRGRLPTGSLRMILKAQSEPYTITRGSKSKNSLGEYTSTEATHEEDLLLYGPTEAQSRGLSGDEFTGDLLGLALPDADIQVDDSLSDGGETYVVEGVTGVPNDRSPRHLSISLRRE